MEGTLYRLVQGIFCTFLATAQIHAVLTDLQHHRQHDESRSEGLSSLWPMTGRPAPKPSPVPADDVHYTERVYTRNGSMASSDHDTKYL